MTLSEFKEKAAEAIRSHMVSSDPPVDECLTNSVFNYNAGLYAALQVVMALDEDDEDSEECAAYYNYILISLNKYNKGRDVDWNTVAKMFRNLKKLLTDLSYDIQITPISSELTASIEIKTV